MLINVYTFEILCILRLFLLKFATFLPFLY